MDSKTYASILKTVCYADIFDYPLREGEVMQRLSSKSTKQHEIKKANGVIHHKHNFMFLAGRDAVIKKRRQREVVSEKKMLLAKRIALLLRFVPSLKLIGVSGSVAVGNAKESDDIDFFVITHTKTIWLTRLVSTGLVEIFAKRRHPDDKDVTNKICLNMFVDEAFLAIPENKRNFYTAHEVCQLKVLYNRDNTYEKFLMANTWVKKYLPNAVSSIKYQVLSINKKQKNTYYIIHATLYIFEWLAKHLQLWYMRKRLTTETVTDHFLAFHPKDYTNDILSAFEKRVKQYGAQV